MRGSCLARRVSPDRLLKVASGGFPLQDPADPQGLPHWPLQRKDIKFPRGFQTLEPNSPARAWQLRKMKFFFMVDESNPPEDTEVWGIASGQ